jgi:type II secretory pathway pseudopilin PulG
MEQEKNKKAFSLIELVLVLGIIALAIPALLALKTSLNKTNQRVKTKNTLDAIQNAIKNTYVANLNYIEKNCVGYNDSNGKCNTLSLLPTIDSSDDTKLVFHIKDDYSYLLNDIKMNHTCSIDKKDTDTYNVMCYDGFGKKITFSGQNLPTPGKKWIAPYAGKYPEIDIKTKFYTKNYNFNDLINLSLSKTVQKEVDIGNGIKRFIRTIKLREFANDCSDGGSSVNPANGLASWDDAMTPWIWEIVSKTPGKLCSGSTTGDNNSCGCLNLENNSGYWETDSNFCIINDDTTWSRIITNLGLDNSYRVDGFGNVLTISMLSDSKGNPTQCPPPAPKVNYFDVPNYPKARIGITDKCKKTASGTFDTDCDWYSAVDIYSE